MYNQPPFQPYSIVGNIPSLTSLPPDGTDTNDFAGVRGPGLVVQERAGTEYYDLRTQTFNTLRGGGVGAFADKKAGTRLLNTGGLAVQLQMLGAEALQFILNAVHKENKATLMQAPRLTVFNTQRAHIMAVRQQAYVQDLTATVGGATATLDPDIGILMTGIVLDVTPIVSHDRQYVTLELRPSLAELQTIRNLTLLTGISNQGPFPVNIQLPFVVLQRAEATVIAPDRGTVMLSGFKDIVYADIETSTPILGDIPVLGFLFKRQTKSHERRRLFILVTPEIIDLQEIEDEQF
jgi:type II secretory pathway component GspD/PulD (secretin)